jgi:hypothetical protein
MKFFDVNIMIEYNQIVKEYNIYMKNQYKYFFFFSKIMKNKNLIIRLLRQVGLKKTQN